MLRRILLASTALVAFAIAPRPAAADPITLAVATGLGVSAATAAVIVNVAATLILTGAQMLLAPRPSPPQVKRQIAEETSLTPYRFAYGRDRLIGTPAPWVVKGGWLYGCLILNSRPSEGPFEVYFDRRRVTLTGDVHDFAGEGARGTVENAPDQGVQFAPHVWIGKGDQTSPPDWILAEAPEHFSPTDGWQGLTVIWLALHAGPNKQRLRLWPRVPPEVMVLGNWSRVWNPADPAQDADDPETWAWSDNQALCLLDALRQNPVERYDLTSILLDSFVLGAEIAERDGFRVNGVLVWAGSELLDQLRPLADAGGGDLVIAGSLVAYAPGAWVEPIYTVTDILADQPITYDAMQPARDVPRAVRASYIEPDRDWQVAELPDLPVPGQDQGDADDRVRELQLFLVTDLAQAARVQRIHANRLAAQRRLSCTLPPAAMILVGGATARVHLPTGWTRLNGVYRVAAAEHVLEIAAGGEGVAFRVPVTLHEDGPEIYEWSPSMVPEIDGTRAEITVRGEVPMPGALSFETGQAAALGRVPRVRIRFAPATFGDLYRVRARADGSQWAQIASLDSASVDGDGLLNAYIDPAVPGVTYEVEAWTVIQRPTATETSEARAGTVVAQAPDSDLLPPIPVEAVGGAGEITAKFRAPNSRDFRGLEVWSGPTDDVADAALLGDVLFGTANMVLEATETGLGASQTRWFFARSLDQHDAMTAFTAGMSATTD